MDMVFPAQAIIERRRSQDDITGQMSDWVSGGGYFVMEPSQEELLFSKINYNLTTFFLWNMTENRNVWSVVFFSQAVPDPVAILNARAELKAEIAFAAYGDVEADMNLPPLGAMAIQSKNILEIASKRHPIFMRAFKLLESYSDRKNWVGLIDIQNDLSI